MLALRKTWMLAVLLAASPCAAQTTAVSPTPPDYPRGKISGYLFGDWYENLAGNPHHGYDASGADSGQANIDGKKNIAKDLNGLQVRRIYFQLDNDLTAKYATRFRLEADGKSLTSDGKVGVAVKAGYVLDRNVYPNADLYLGIVPTILFENTEAFWGYRSIEKTAGDFRGIEPSADQGAVLKGFVDGNRVLGYTAIVSNGPGQKAETNRQKRYGLSLPIHWRDLRVEPYAAYENVYGAQDRATYRVFAGYELPYHGAIGWETIEQVQHVPGAKPTKQLISHSAFVRVAPRPEFAAFARVDLWDPDHHQSVKTEETLWMAGCDWQPVKDVHFMPNVEGMKYSPKGGDLAIVNTSLPTHGLKNDIQARLTFYYVFSKPQS